MVTMVTKLDLRAFQARAVWRPASSYQGLVGIVKSLSQSWRRGLSHLTAPHHSSNKNALAEFKKRMTRSGDKTHGVGLDREVVVREHCLYSPFRVLFDKLPIPSYWRSSEQLPVHNLHHSALRAVLENSKEIFSVLRSYLFLEFFGWFVDVCLWVIAIEENQTKHEFSSEPWRILCKAW